jgi:Zn-finger nucleic acid-binding protein
MMGKTSRTGIASFNCPNCGAAAKPDSVSCDYCRSPISATICPACFGAVSKRMKHCPSCGAAIKPPVPQKGQMRCPRCDEELSHFAIGTHSLNGCLQCGGQWLDKDSFQDICKREEEQEAVLGFTPPEPVPVASGKPRRTYIPCPECGKLMNHKNFAGRSGVVLDWCRDHGSWFDRHELHRVITFIRNGGLREAREHERNQLKEQEHRLRLKEIKLSALDRQFGADSGGSGVKKMSNSAPILEYIIRMFR